MDVRSNGSVSATRGDDLRIVARLQLTVQLARAHVGVERADCLYESLPTETMRLLRLRARAQLEAIEQAAMAFSQGRWTGHG